MSDGVNTKYMALLAAAPQIGDSCLQANKKFVQCKQGDQNPASCVSEGEKVVSCTLSVLRKAESKCEESFQAYQHCLMRNNRQFERCRDQQKAFEKCFTAPEQE
mmetsp:Transcript_12705/g.24654  ORF Transcript_12705/g.24654 Transcript_12705/m.24654 type:complete len:104 (+) Transcript_12705:182-493(+)|eukprot:CAMPEP_0171490710 /NCGR_PEP_ID=MMETSP0958-20121227/3456_1 /TAXON_ID=87120 /ORGANISM="Aurantiochytrium limacinum, Strain ATCCMYA-1381" /LENGTH=103 /DNA_ID=CAMNT_0012024049 /DNA_START=244 /DNA_END=555 /DNA_ORIENTATION=-